MSETVWEIGQLGPGEYWVEDVTTGVQVGWVNRDEQDGSWCVLDTDFRRRAGPFRTLKEAVAAATDALADQFGIGSPAN